MAACTVAPPEEEQIIGPCEAAGIYPDKRGNLEVVVTAFNAFFKDDTAKISITLEITNQFPETILDGEMRIKLVDKTKWKILGMGPRIDLTTMGPGVKKTITKEWNGISHGYEIQAVSAHAEDLGIYSSHYTLNFAKGEPIDSWCYAALGKFIPFSEREVECNLEIEEIFSELLNQGMMKKGDLYVKNFEPKPKCWESLETKIGILLEAHQEGSFNLFSSPPRDTSYWVQVLVGDSEGGKTLKTKMDSLIKDSFLGSFMMQSNGLYLTHRRQRQALP